MPKADSNSKKGMFCLQEMAGGWRDSAVAGGLQLVLSRYVLSEILSSFPLSLFLGLEFWLFAHSVGGFFGGEI